MLHEVLQDLESYPALPIDKTSLTRSMSIHEAFETRNFFFFENRKSLSANMKHYLSGSVQRAPNGAFPWDSNLHTLKRSHIFGNIFPLQFITKTKQLDKLAGVKKCP